MATKEEQQKIIKEMQEAQAKRAAVSQKTGRVARGEKKPAKPVKAQPASQEDQKKQQSNEEKVAALTKELEAQRAKSNKLEKQNKVAKIGNYQSEEDKQKAVLQSKDDYHFVKEYTVKADHGRESKIVVKMHAPSLAEQADIQQEYTDLTSGRGVGFVAMARELFLAVAYFRVVGDNVPQWFTDIDNTYRTDILLEVWADYNDWVDKFLDTQLH